MLRLVMDVQCPECTYEFDVNLPEPFQGSAAASYGVSALEDPAYRAEQEAENRRAALVSEVMDAGAGVNPADQGPLTKSERYLKAVDGADPWAGRSAGMRCSTCMWYAPKSLQEMPAELRDGWIGRCRRHAPTMNGYPVVFPADWCGDHKLDEAKS